MFIWNIYAGLNDISIHSLRHRMKHHAEKGMLSCVSLLTSPFIFQAVKLMLYFQGSVHQRSRKLCVLLKARAIRHASCLWPFSWCLVSLGQLYGDNTVEKVGIGKFEVTFSNEFTAHVLTLELHPFFTILCVPPLDLSISSVLLGLGSLLNQCWYYQGHYNSYSHWALQMYTKKHTQVHTYTYTFAHKCANKSSKLNKKPLLLWVVFTLLCCAEVASKEVVIKSPREYKRSQPMWSRGMAYE